MNAAVLLILSVAIFAMAVRFFLKFLALGVFRTPAETVSGPPRAYALTALTHISTNALLGQHLAATVSVVTIIGVFVAATWGWVPAFLWIVIASVVAAGTYAVGSTWLTLEHGRKDPARIARDMLGPVTGGVFYALTLLLLFLLTPLLALVGAELMVANPDATAAFFVQLPIMLALAWMVRTQPSSLIVAALVVALVLILASIILGGFWPIRVTGELLVDFGHTGTVAFDPRAVWILAILLVAYTSLRMPIRSLNLGHGYLTGVMLILALLLLYAGVLVELPEIVAPQFHRAKDLPSAIPLMFLVVTGGALAGYHALVTGTTTVRQLTRIDDAPLISYGGALLDGALAVGVLVIAVTGFATTEDWVQARGTWPAETGLHTWLQRFVDGFAHYAGGLGIPEGMAKTFGVLLCANLLLATIQTGLRVQRYLIGETTRAFGLQGLSRPVAQRRLTVALVALIALIELHGHDPMRLWILFGSANQIYATCVLAVIVIALLRAGLPPVFAAGPLAVVLPLALWATLSQLLDWAGSGHWFALGVGVILLGLGLWVLVQASRIALPLWLDYRQRESGSLGTLDR